MTRSDLRVIAWDFDGVLNRNVIDGRFVWMDGFERDTGASLKSFADYLFKGRFQEAMIGKADLKTLIGDWVEHDGYLGTAETIMSYWFDIDAKPDARMLAMMERTSELGIKNVMATNNEAHRTDYIEHHMGFGAKMDQIFAAGRMCVAKPDDGYFHHITDDLSVTPDQILLIDDFEENIEAASKLGWHTHHFLEDGYDALEKVLGL